MTARLLIATVLGIAVAFLLAGRAIAQPSYDDVAASVAGHPVSVHCGTWDEYAAAGPGPFFARVFLGFTILDGSDDVYLNPDVCAGLARPSEPRAFGAAVLILAHESVHQRGVRDELRAECLALPLVSRTALDLGADPRRIGVVRAGARAQHDRLAPEYRGKCPRLIPFG